MPSASHVIDRADASRHGTGACPRRRLSASQVARWLRSSRVRTVGLIVLALTGAAGCADSPVAPEISLPRYACNSPGPVSAPAGYPFVFSLEAPASVSTGQSIRFALRVTNPTSATRYLWTGRPEESLNVIVETVSGRLMFDLWEAENGSIRSLTAVGRPIEPGATLSLEATWNGRDLRGRTVPPGEYRAFVALYNNWFAGSSFADRPPPGSLGEDGPCAFRSAPQPLTVVAR